MTLGPPAALFCALWAGPSVVVTVDDLPIASDAALPAERARITTELLQVLAKHKIQAVGLVTWKRVSSNSEALLGQWLEAGHELANHSANHLSLTHTKTERYIADVEEGRRRLASFLKKRGRPGPRWFRFPYLREGDTPDKLEAVRRYLSKSKQHNLPVTIDLQDWSFDEPWRQAKNRKQVARRYQSHLRRAVEHHSRRAQRLFGREVPQVMLLHANSVGAAQWDELFSWMRTQGYTFVSVNDVMSDPAYSVTHHFVGSYGHSLWDRLRAQRQNKAAKKAIVELLQQQADDWNRGDLKAFTEVYADDAAFLSPSGLKQGRLAILSRYRKKYDTPAKRGQLSLQVVETRIVRGPEFTREQDAVLGRIQGASTILRWHIKPLTKAGLGRAKGYSLVTWRRTVHGWRIEQDASM